MPDSLPVMSDTTTQGIRVQVFSFFVPERSDQRTYFFAYHIRIRNVGDATAQLLTRHWIITDANGAIEHVRGPGVVGETPRLKPGESFEYTSACPLQTPFGHMRGTFQMIRDDGATFDAVVSQFPLTAPHVGN